MLFIDTSFVITEAKADKDMQSSLVKSFSEVGSITVNFHKTDNFLRRTANLGLSLIIYY